MTKKEQVSIEVLSERITWIERMIKVLTGITLLNLIMNLDKVVPIINHFIHTAYAAQ